MANITNGLGQTKVGVRQPAELASSLLLDTYSGAAAAYSLRKLRNAYAGSAIRVRRSSDNTSQDIGFNANGNLDTTSLLSFVGAGNGFVSIWYDQSGNGNNAAQTTSGYQPQIVNAGAVLLTNSKPSILLDGVDDNFILSSNINANASIYNTFVGKRAASGDRLFGLSGHSGYSYLLALWNINQYLFQGKTGNYQISSSTDTTTNQLLLTGKVSSGVMSMFKNGSVITSIEQPGGVIPTINSIGQYFNTFIFAKCSLQEIIFYNSDQTSNQTGLDLNINTYYSIY